MPLSTEVDLDSGHIVLDGNPAHPAERGTVASPFWPMCIVAKRSPISASAGLLSNFWCFVVTTDSNAKF